MKQKGSDSSVPSPPDSEGARREQLAELNKRIELGLDQLNRGEAMDGTAARRRAIHRLGKARS